MVHVADLSFSPFIYHLSALAGGEIKLAGGAELWGRDREKFITAAFSGWGALSGGEGKGGGRENGSCTRPGCVRRNVT